MEETKVTGNRVNLKYKDRLFKLIFQRKEDMLQLYNAVNGTDYQNPDEIEFNTLDDAIYMGMKNDVSYLMQDVMNLYEHQSTFSPNLPLRGLLYFSDLYRKIIEGNHDIYSSKRIPLEYPQFLVFYNGTQQEPEQQIMFLSDAYPERYDKKKAALECKAVVLNINLGYNKNIMNRCRKLKEYAIFIACIRKYQNEEKDIRTAIDFAVEECIAGNILADILRDQRQEVTDMLLTEYNEQAHLQSEREIAIEEGKQIGEEIGRKEGEKIGKQIGRKEGEKVGANQLGKLISALLSEGRTEDAARAAVDEKFREQMYQEYGIGKPKK